MRKSPAYNMILTITIIITTTVLLEIATTALVIPISITLTTKVTSITIVPSIKPTTTSITISLRKPNYHSSNNTSTTPANIAATTIATPPFLHPPSPENIPTSIHSMLSSNPSTTK